MTRQRYSIKESLNRILRILEGKPLPDDAPETVSGELLSENEAFSDIAELLGSSLPSETLNLPISSTAKFGSSPNYAYFGSDGTFRLTGSATAWEDLRVDGLNTRVGAVAPTDETGFRGNANFYVRNFVHNQADEVQFDVQMPHAWNVGSTISPHVHFSPWITGTQAVQAVRFVLDYYWGNINGEFPTGSSSYTMEYVWTGSFQWKHLIAEHSGSDLSGTGQGMSSIIKCRLYRDNTITNNLAGKITFLYFDIHYEADSFGSSSEYTK